MVNGLSGWSFVRPVTVDFAGNNIGIQCKCPYDGRGDCKHIVAVILAIVDGPPQDDSERVETVLKDVSTDELREFVGDVLATHSDLRERFLARFADDHKSVEAYREEIAQLFEHHADPVVFEAMDFFRFFETALDGYANCVLAADPTAEEFDTYAGVLEARASTDPPVNKEQFWRALDDLENRYNE